MSKKNKASTDEWDAEHRKVVWQISSQLQELAEIWLREGIEFPDLNTQKRAKSVEKIISNKSLPAISHALTSVLMLYAANRTGLNGTVLLALDQMQNRARYLGGTTKKPKEEKALRVLALWQEQEKKGISKASAAQLIATTLINEGFRTTSASVRRMLTDRRLLELKARYLADIN